MRLDFLLALAIIAAATAPVCSQSSEPWPERIDLLGLDGINGFSMPGLAIDDEAGASVAILGDVNGDGVDDIAIGTPGLGDRAGGVVVVYGRPGGLSFPPNIELAGLQPGEGFRVSGEERNDRFGITLADAGDVNGDGLSDLVVGAPTARSGAGDAYLIFGERGPVPVQRTVAELSQGRAVRLRGHNPGGYGDQAGWGLAGLGDFNGDGVDDLAVGAPGEHDGTGMVYVIYGHRGDWPAEIQLREIAAEEGLRISAGDDEGLGFTLDAGDTNGDGLGDILIGAPPASPGTRLSAGSVYLLLGSHLHAGTVRLPWFDASKSTRFDGLVEDGRAGIALAVLGDVDGDGLSDVAVTRNHASGGAQSRVSVRFGSGWPAPFLPIMPLWGTHPSIGFDIAPAFGLRSLGAAIDGADLDADGITDLVVGIPDTNYLGGRAYAGRVYVFFGGVPRGAAVNPLTEREGVSYLAGPEIESYAGAAVSAGGDVNGDGIADLLVGAPTRRGATPGSAHVIFGRAGTPCRADIDGDGALTVFDFLAFQTAFAAGDLETADFDGDGTLTLFDFLVFQTEFDAGCA